MIGIVGGLGPYAGVDLMTKILQETRAEVDQDHVPIVLISIPNAVPDRTDFLLNKPGVQNPGKPLAEVLEKLNRMGVTVAGIPCNTSHASAIAALMHDELRRRGVEIRVLNMIAEVADFTRLTFAGTERIGVLATTGTVASKIYDQHFGSVGLRVIYPSKATQSRVHTAIYDRQWGIKASGSPPSERAAEIVQRAMRELIDEGAQAVVLACTELPLAMQGQEMNGVPILDATRILARALVREYAPDKLTVRGSSLAI